MRAKLFVLLAICVFAPFATAQQAKPAALAANKEIAKQFYVPFATGDATVMSKVMTPAWEDIPLAPGQKPGRDGLVPIVKMLRGMFSNLSIVSQDFVAEGDKVTVRTVWSGKHAGDFFGIKPTGKSITLNTTDIHQIANGHIIRTWHLEDMMGVYAQLGGLDPKH
jgi:predicted ester cyclase